MRAQRLITDKASDPFAGLKWKKVDVEICSADPAQRVRLTDIEVPATWSYGAAETFARYYIRRAGVPVALTKVKEKEIPEFLWRSVADTAALQGMPEEERTTQETSAKQVFRRLAGPGLTGVLRRGISIRKKMHGRSMMKSARCWRGR